MPLEDADQHWMRLALAQAERSVGLASPNPAVGCVVVAAGQLVGEGFHQYDLRDHAEIVALRQAGSLARGATAYVTLEPCSHHGRTGPCADALLAAGIGRVVLATVDPNPLVCGQGMARLRDAGIEVLAGVLEQPARQLNDGFARFIAASLPFVTMKVASSLDGRIAPAHAQTGSMHRITAEVAQAQVQRMRHASDALVTGVGTVVADDPLLTDRSGLPRRRPLLRVVLDSTLRTPLTSRLIESAADDVLIVFRHASVERQQQFRERGVRLEQIDRLDDVFAHLGKSQLTSVLLEAGTRLHTAALGENLVDKLVLFYAPMFLGSEAVPMLAPSAQVPVFQSCEWKTYGQDFALEAYLRDPWPKAH